jgi:ribosomal protein S7
MSINANNNKNIPVDKDARYEEVASQEELYLEETEEEVVAILTSYVSPISKSDRPIVDVRAKRQSGLEIEVATDVTNPRMVTNADEQLVKAIEELITGDSDDPPLSEDSIQEMLTD